MTVSLHIILSNTNRETPLEVWTTNTCSWNRSLLPLSRDLSRALGFFLTKVRTTVWPVCFITSNTSWLVIPWRLTPSIWRDRHRKKQCKKVQKYSSNKVSTERLKDLRLAVGRRLECFHSGLQRCLGRHIWQKHQLHLNRVRDEWTQIKASQTNVRHLWKYSATSESPLQGIFQETPCQYISIMFN